MAEDNQPGIVGNIVGKVGSGVYDGVKGAVIGAGVGVATAGLIAGVDEIGDGVVNLASKVTPAAESVDPTMLQKAAEAVKDFGGGLARINIDYQDGPKGSFIESAGFFAGILSAVGAAVGAVTGFLGLTSSSDRKLERENEVQSAQIGQLATATQMLGGAVMQTQQELANTNKTVGVIGEHTKKILMEHAAERSTQLAHKDASGVQKGSFVAKEDARKAAVANSVPSIGA